MRFLLILLLFFNGCGGKFLQKSEDLKEINSTIEPENVLSIVKQVNDYDHTSPWIWFGIIIGFVCLFCFAPLLLKK
tara:strand:- start:37027 stop:37254 length:228 start_codon:yes stop_codon:yes gene_type:complete